MITAGILFLAVALAVILGRRVLGRKARRRRQRARMATLTGPQVAVRLELIRRAEFPSESDRERDSS